MLLYVFTDNTGIWVLSVIIDNIQMRSVPSDLLKNYSNLLGHSDVKTTMIYTHTVQSRTIKESKSPLDFWVLTSY